MENVWNVMNPSKLVKRQKKILKVTGFTSFAQILKKNYRNVDNVNANIKNKKYTSGFILSKLKNNTEIVVINNY